MQKQASTYVGIVLTLAGLGLTVSGFTNVQLAIALWVIAVALVVGGLASIFWHHLKRLWHKLSTGIDTEPSEKKQTIEKIEKHFEIEVPQDGHFVKMAYADRPISFKILISNYTEFELSINKISYKIYYQDKVVQEKTYQEPIVIEAEARKLPKYLDYFPFLSPTGIPKSNQNWDIKGVAFVDSEHGPFVKHFESSRKLSIDTSTRWQEAYDYYIKEKE